MSTLYSTVRSVLRFIRCAGTGPVVLLFCLACGTETPLPTPPTGPSAAILWRNAAATGGGRPGIDSQRVYTFSLDQIVRALDAKTGQIVWSRTLDAAYGNSGLDVLAAGSRVLVDGGDLFALDPNDGSVLWRFQPSDASGVGLSLIDADQQHAFVGARNGRGHLYSVSLATGQQQWDASLYADDSTRVADPIVSGGVVFARFHVWRPDGIFLGGAAAADATTGKVLWSVVLPFETTPRSMITWADALDETHLYISTDDGRVFALDRVTGQIQWTLAPVSARVDIRPLAVAGSTLIVGSTTGYVTAVRASDGGQLWQKTAQVGSVAPVIVSSGDQVFVTHVGGNVVSFDVQTGKIVWSLDAGYAIGSRLLGDQLFGAGPFGATAIKVR
jgi:outer membrane protein assembly factor BamB